jgi:hypothetical protein
LYVFMGILYKLTTAQEANGDSTGHNPAALFSTVRKK